MFNVGDTARVHCSNATPRTWCTEDLEVAVETAFGFTFHMVAYVIYRLGAARILVATQKTDSVQISPAYSAKDR